jgi:hypothetical protein
MSSFEESRRRETGSMVKSSVFIPTLKVPGQWYFDYLVKASWKLGWETGSAVEVMEGGHFEFAAEERSWEFWVTFKTVAVRYDEVLLTSGGLRLDGNFEVDIAWVPWQACSATWNFGTLAPRKLMENFYQFGLSQDVSDLYVSDIFLL